MDLRSALEGQSLRIDPTAELPRRDLEQLPKIETVERRFRQRNRLLASLQARLHSNGPSGIGVLEDQHCAISLGQTIFARRLPHTWTASGSRKVTRPTGRRGRGSPLLVPLGCSTHRTALGRHDGNSAVPAIGAAKITPGPSFLQERLIEPRRRGNRRGPSLGITGTLDGHAQPPRLPTGFSLPRTTHSEASSHLRSCSTQMSASPAAIAPESGQTRNFHAAFPQTTSGARLFRVPSAETRKADPPFLTSSPHH